MSIDGTPISEADMARIEAEEELHAEWQRKPSRVVAASSHDVDDCRMLLSMLGLERETSSSTRPGTATGRAPRSADAAAVPG